MDGQYRKDAGIAGESAALTYLRDRGLKLVAQNYRCKVGEIDLAMLDGATLALIEVRYRADASFGGAAASVIWCKQRRIIRAAHHLLQTHAELRSYPARFDVVAVSPSSNGLQVEWIKAAFATNG